MMHVGEPKIPAVVSAGDLRLVEAEQVEQCRLQVAGCGELRDEQAVESLVCREFAGDPVGLEADRDLDAGGECGAGFDLQGAVEAHAPVTAPRRVRVVAARADAAARPQAFE